MKGKIFDFGIALLIGFFLTDYIVRFLIKNNFKLGLYSVPNNRSLHNKNMPNSGGLSFGISFILLNLFYYIRHQNFELSHQLLVLSIGSIFILILGILDDKYNLRALYKLLIMIIIASTMYFFGFKINLITNPIGNPINLGFLSYFFTVGWYLIIMNSFNLLDGMDGLLMGVTIIVSLTLFITGIRFNNPYVIFLCFSLMVSGISFLRYNFYPAKIFMGDTGSLLLGFLIASISIIGMAEFKSITAMTMLIPISTIIVPLLDTVLSIFRRTRNKVNIFTADKEHLHHKMLSFGYSQRYIALLAYTITFIFGLISLGFSFFNIKIFFITLSILILLSIILIIYIFKRDLYK